MKTDSFQHLRIWPSWLVGVCIVVGYFVTGKLGLLLAIPPGYATAIWPASGIALAALIAFGGRYWPAVWLGSAITNVIVAFTATDAAMVERLMITAFTIGAGAAAQAYVGRVLINRTMGLPTQLIAAKDVFRFLILGGPVACLVNATWGVSVLVVNGSIPLSGVAYSWWTWWVGDTIGVLIFAPLALMWLDRSPAWKTRRWIVTASLCTTFLAAVMVFIYASRSEWNVLKRSFDKSTQEIGTALNRRIELHAKNLESVASLFAASNDVDREEFRRFTRPMVAQNGDVMGVGWVPRVERSQRALVEAKLPASARHPFFFEMQKPWPRTADRDEYTPVLYFTQRSNADISGFDLSSEVTRRKTLNLARDHGALTASPMVPMTLAPGEPYDGFLMVQPIYAQDGERAGTVEERRVLLRGYAIEFFRLSEFLGHRDVTSIADGRIHFTIEDITDGSPATLLYQDVVKDDLALLPGMTSTSKLSVGSREWRISFAPTLAYITSNTTMVVWFVLAGGLLFSALVGTGALILTGRTTEIEALVKKRTEELAEINEKLSFEVCDHIRTENTLREEHSFIELVLDNLSEGVIAFDTEGKTTLNNAGARRTLRRFRNENVAPLDSSDVSRLLESASTDAIGISPVTLALRGETVTNFEIVSTAGSRRPITLLATARPILSSNGERTGALLVLRDVSDTRESDRLKHEFVSVISHELRTPLTSIRGSLGLMSSGAAGQLPPQAQQMTAIALRNCERLSKLINELLDIEKMESGHLALDMQIVPLQPLLIQAVESHAGYAKEHQVEFSVVDHLEREDDVLVRADPDRLLQVMANLLSNAAKFSPSGSQVEVGIQLRGDTVRVFVRDYGNGISREFQPRIFEKFSQADGSDARSRHGTGLGLAITKALIERMDGRVDYVTQEGRGTTFFFDLPRIAGDSSIETLRAGAA